MTISIALYDASKPLDDESRIAQFEAEAIPPVGALVQTIETGGDYAEHVVEWHKWCYAFGKLRRVDVGVRSVKLESASNKRRRR